MTWITYGSVHDTYFCCLGRRYASVERLVSVANLGGSNRIFWHRELPPADAEPIGEHVVEATSTRVPATLSHRDELWDRCNRELMARATVRLEQEMTRLGGDYAHVLDESIDSRHDDVTGETWLHGRFTYMLYRQPVR